MHCSRCGLDPKGAHATLEDCVFDLRQAAMVAELEAGRARLRGRDPRAWQARARELGARIIELDLLRERRV